MITNKQNNCILIYKVRAASAPFSETISPPHSRYLQSNLEKLQPVYHLKFKKGQTARRCSHIQNNLRSHYLQKYPSDNHFILTREPVGNVSERKVINRTTDKETFPRKHAQHWKQEL
ncbi:hypothetical protein O6H91_02G011200 [Diphasiastrum complanatum]|uniref:Uncharacterized protein n=1 Tax=Diphasiastrum complanatum TaxID=34168 RepID=A0ACC2ECW2_DIPCM|nr:hypothetical protein O6H91_02G011200 [Diphasiastrum complanatum]